jgi:hypothetical protein
MTMIFGVLELHHNPNKTYAYQGRLFGSMVRFEPIPKHVLERTHATKAKPMQSRQSYIEIDEYMSSSCSIGDSES